MEAHRALELMDDFATRTGLTSDREPTRYLWTDAFAVCNYLGLARQTDQTDLIGLAGRLVDQVHHTLGCHRDDDQRTGWLSGLAAENGEAHPTAGGLRIGKPLPERAPDAPIDQRLEWERDGQYFHYLTKWVHALNRMAGSLGEVQCSQWARELAHVAHAGFVYTPTGADRPRMHWKMSVDLSRPLVASMGHHDPLDGYITCLDVETTTVEEGAQPEPTLDEARRDFAAMLGGRDWTTQDPLGLGGLLMDACRLDQLIAHDALADEVRAAAAELLVTLLRAAQAGLTEYARTAPVGQPASLRLAFRELGLALGLAGVDRMLEADAERPDAAEVRAHLEPLASFGELGERIVAFWADPAARRSDAWADHEDINQVMLAAALAPDGMLWL